MIVRNRRLFRLQPYKSEWHLCENTLEKEIETPKTEYKDAGFSTIEILVSLIILSVALLPLIDTQLNLLQSVNRLEEIDKLNRSKRATLRHMRYINPETQPKGEHDFGYGKVKWSSRLYHKDSQFRQIISLEARSIGLYETAFTISIDEKVIFSDKILQVGWTGRKSHLTD